MFWTSRRVYMDNTATTRTRKEVISEIKKYFDSEYANPSSIHESGLIARGSVEMARERIAGVLSCDSNEIVFTASGSESNNMAIIGAARANRGRGRHVVTSKIEHSSVIKAFDALEREGFEVTRVGVDSCGRIDIKELESVIRPDTILVSIHYVNNEIGTVQNIEKIISLVKSKGALFHADAVQALPYFKIDLKALKADLMSFSGHKLYAPKGVGMLFIRNGAALEAIIHGGGQEMGLRSGTENVAYIVGLSRAVVLNNREKEDYCAGLLKMRSRLIDGVLKRIDGCALTGDDKLRAPNHASFVIRGVSGRMLVKRLSQKGFDVSSGSACSSPENTPSHVLLACGVDESYLYGNLRVTLGRYNQSGDIDRFVDALEETVRSMRENKVDYENETIFISQKEFREKLAAGENMQILDVRHIKYPRVTIPGSIYIPVWLLDYRIKTLKRDVMTVVVCFQDDIVSPQVHQTLIKNGFSKVKVLKGGMFSYAGFDR
ncbi:MAG TPA: aminotransferase class V-fold PLP-dependent enzyme [Candidatus Wallbacteria bacterium]|nr:aminotransferase class V-fold PLP-dependent enzyme [Candidatus Wallbacteria bacterium]